MIEISEIERVILQAIGEGEVRVMNPRQDGLHFDAVVVSPRFEGKSLVEQHRLVMGALKELFGSSLHAMGLKTYTPQEWENEHSSRKN